MNDCLFSIDVTLYCKVTNSKFFGGLGSVGYCTILIDNIEEDSDENDNVLDTIVTQAKKATKQLIEDFEIQEEDLELISKNRFFEESSSEFEEDDQCSLFDEEDE